MSLGDKIELLVERIQDASGREWINSYFDLVKQTLDVANLDNGDPRLVMSLSPNRSGWRFPVTINNRYVIAFHKSAKSAQTHFVGVGLILNHRAKEIPDLQEHSDIDEWGPFKNLPGEYSKPPYFVHFGNLREALGLLEKSERVYLAWKEAILSETKRAKASPYRKFHEPLIYRMATDISFRARILDIGYSESKPQLGLLPEEIDAPQEFVEGASKVIRVNAYERNKQARESCIEHYGVTCAVCDMSFEEKYGEIGKGFIHVHHIRPLGTIGVEYKVNPIKDLRPVCPNCHAMLHMRKPPYGIEELRSMLQG